MPCWRLVDSSLWIAFHRIGRLSLLLRLPSIAIARVVLRELQRGRDELPQRIGRALRGRCFDLDLEADDLAATLADILTARDRRLSAPDAIQVAWAQLHAQTTVLYMRDTPAQQQARGTGAPVRGHQELLRDMVALGLLTPDEAVEVGGELERYFRPRGGRP